MINNAYGLPMGPLVVKYSDDDPYGDIEILCDGTRVARLVLDDAPVHDFNSRQRQLAQLFAVSLELFAACEAIVNRLEMHVNNPSAWEHYDQSVSDLIEATVKQCRAVVAKAKGGLA